MIVIDLHEILAQASLYEYVSQYVDLQYRCGQYWGLSPFQSEETPSFSLNESKKVWKDFSSGKGGNLITFIMEYKHLSFHDAVHELLAWLNLPDDSYTPPLKIVQFMKRYIGHKTLKKDCFHEPLPESVLRKYSNKPIKMWENEGISLEKCAEFGILYDPYEDSAIIPIRDAEGRLINISRRTLDPNYKQLGIPKYIYKYPMGTTDFFYAWYKSKDEIQSKKEVIVVEGAKSVIKLYEYGYRNSVAALTSHLNEAQAKILAKTGCSVVIAFDKDVQPYKDQYIRWLTRLCPIYYTLDREGLLGEKDSPVDKGKEVWEKLYETKIRVR